MTDRYLKLANAPLAGGLLGKLGLPRPDNLTRNTPGAPVIRRPVLLGEVSAGRLGPAAAYVLADADARVVSRDAPREPLGALVFDASGIADCSQLATLHGFFHAPIGELEPCGRVLVLSTPPGECISPAAFTAQRALEGFTRSLAKELGRGRTVQLVQVAPGGEGSIASTLRFLLSPRSAYVSGQVIRIGAARVNDNIDWQRPFTDKVALVTGASRGIGAATAGLLAAEGAQVVGIDIPALSADLDAVIEPLGGHSLPLDVTDRDAPTKIAEALVGGVDLIVHNAGVTRDRTLAKMGAERWSELMDINLCSQERIDQAVLEAGLLRANGRIVCLSSMSAIAGNGGQTNYATSKAGVIGRVQALAGELAGRGCTINAVAPGFIETEMTARVPLLIREAGRRMSSLMQGGAPIDVAETIAWLAHPGSAAINGSVIRVCGQNLLGA